MQTFHCLILGNPGVGKSTFLQRYATGAYHREYVPTLVPTMVSLRFTTSQGDVMWHIYEHADPAQLPHPIDAALILASVCDPYSCSDVANYHSWVLEKLGPIPVVVCGNKVDAISSRQVSPYLCAQFARRVLPTTAYYELSARSSYNFEKPFLNLLRALLGPDLHFCERPPAAMPLT